MQILIRRGFGVVLEKFWEACGGVLEKVWQMFGGIFGGYLEGNFMVFRGDITYGFLKIITSL